MSVEHGERHTLAGQVYALVRQIPRGQVASYGQLAALCGRPRASRVVGGIMRACPWDDVPCHRVVRKDGGLAPGDAFGAPGFQMQMLRDEGVAFAADGCVDMMRHQWPGPQA